MTGRLIREGEELSGFLPFFIEKATLDVVSADVRTSSIVSVFTSNLQREKAMHHRWIVMPSLVALGVTMTTAGGTGLAAMYPALMDKPLGALPLPGMALMEATFGKNVLFGHLMAFHSIVAIVMFVRSLTASPNSPQDDAGSTREPTDHWRQ